MEKKATSDDAAGAWEPFSTQRGKREYAWEDDVKTFKRDDTFKVVEIVCQEELHEGSGDGLCAAVLARHGFSEVEIAALRGEGTLVEKRRR